ncbi:2Fe-2S iron-sulfur cluster binding domain-containing protein [Spongiibacter sp. KMU-158]|uniref:2Fe-2S iron-sulfur cluster binding domain-containing protein n=1 Tax=Spongiibacter pelagi TaxID=2760804 RepID=A0A927BYE8_9GAMM|nr:2Fe-2S iron-sulfur cluster-binding protein [Spongiibacter pelagi]MBD2857849.1 2Fe-2S iron-sulfur cluster binding domain-containing protein [Spongiibacter pelagi]
MTEITYVEHNGTEHTVDVDEGMSLMEGATLNMVPGIEGMCGGICSCATCHCYIELSDQQGLPAISEGEEDMLCGVEDRRPESRLGCQVPVTSAMNGLRVAMPESQS